MAGAEVRTVVLRVAALALLLLLALVATITIRTLNRVPNATIYMVESGATRFTLQPVHRRLDAREPEGLARAGVSALARGPSEQERADGLTSAVPEDTEVREARFSAGRLVVDLNEAFTRGGGSASMLGRLEQVRWTLTQPNAVEELELRVDGDRLDVLGGEGLLVEQPWRRPAGEALPSW